jgi:ribosome maturation protein Sdo1
MTIDVLYDGETYQIRNGRVFRYHSQRRKYLPVASQSLVKEVKRRAIDQQNPAPNPGPTNRSLFV